MLDEIAFIVLTTIVLAASTCIQPVAARCPHNWRHNGVGVETSSYRSRGDFECRYFPFEETDRNIVDYPGRIGGHIYCGAHTTPVVVDDRMVACRP